MNIYLKIKNLIRCLVIGLSILMLTSLTGKNLHAVEENGCTNAIRTAENFCKTLNFYFKEDEENCFLEQMGLSGYELWEDFEFSSSKNQYVCKMSNSKPS